MRQIRIDPNFESWQRAAKWLLLDETPPHHVEWIARGAERQAGELPGRGREAAAGVVVDGDHPIAGALEEEDVLVAAEGVRAPLGVEERELDQRERDAGARGERAQAPVALPALHPGGQRRARDAPRRLARERTPSRAKPTPAK